MSLKSMADIWKEMEKTHGEEGLFIANSNMHSFTDVISTGSYALDDALGIWGVPKGHIVQLAGFESSGKTLLSLSVIREWQKKDPKNWALYVDAEHTFDPKWAASLGVDNDRLMVYKENSGVLIFERLVGQASKPAPGKVLPTKKAKEGILDMVIRSGDCGKTGLGVIVMDSVAAISPPIEEGSATGKQNIAPMARFLPEVLRKVTPLLTKSGVTMIMINQVRTKPDAMYGDPTTSPGGQALKHACSQMINLGKMNGKDAQILLGEEQVGHHIRAKVEKNKKAPPFRRAEFAIKYLEGITNKNIELRDLAVKYGVIKKPNNLTYELDGVKFKGKEAMASALLDEETQAQIFERIKQAKLEMINNNIPVQEEIEKPEYIDDETIDESEE